MLPRLPPNVVREAQKGFDELGGGGGGGGGDQRWEQQRRDSRGSDERGSRDERPSSSYRDLDTPGGRGGDHRRDDERRGERDGGGGGGRGGYDARDRDYSSYGQGRSAYGGDSRYGHHHT